MNPIDTARDALREGRLALRSARADLAVAHFERAAQLDPGNAEAHHLLGIVAARSGQPERALRHLQHCVAIDPGHADALNNLGTMLRQLGRSTESIAVLRRALDARPQNVDAAFNLGISCELADDVDGAETAYRQVLSWRAAHVEAAINLGNLLRRQARPAEAVALLEEAHRLAPERDLTNGNLALALIDVGRAVAAEQFALAATEIAPRSPRWWRALATAQRLLHRLDAAVASLRQALALDPNDDATKFLLGLTLRDSSATDDARAVFATTTAPAGMAEKLRWADAFSLPAIYRDEGHIDAERAHFGASLQRIGGELRLDAVAQVREAYAAVIDDVPFHLHYQPRDNTDLQRGFGGLVGRVMARSAPELAQPCTWRPRARDGRIRVGIVSSHLCEHTVSRYFADMLTGLDPRRFDVRAWYLHDQRDATSEAICARLSAFKQMKADPVAIARDIRADEMDLLIYPEIGMDSRHHALAALRLAPVQSVLYGHPATSGLANVDYFLSGDAYEPSDATAHYTERLVRLPGLGACPQRAPAPHDAGWLDTGADEIVLLCPQNIIKIEPAFDRVLARICAATAAQIGFFAREAPLVRLFRARIESTFAASGLDPARYLRLYSYQGYSDYLAGLARASLVLDSAWFSGGSTSLDAFGVGAPVLTWNARMARGRQTAGMLRLMEIDGLVANSEDEFVARAAALSRDPDWRRTTRAQILERNAALFDGRQVVAALEDFIVSAVG